ncbi:GGDEF domain-containing protein [uncultured Deinococcus sp.]|uniref:GGDEF domain-containing protein n=1 Tax=uncultured Deinococcus sp. TaxID=158789 RepID=UPI0025EFE163|nr:GGDEF domain-containing protein [uncultured Deinococcus sp.]
MPGRSIFLGDGLFRPDGGSGRLSTYRVALPLGLSALLVSMVLMGPAVTTSFDRVVQPGLAVVLAALSAAAWVRGSVGRIDQLLLISGNVFLVSRLAFTLAAPDLPARAAILATGLPWIVVLLLMNGWLLNRHAATLVNAAVVFSVALCALAWWPGTAGGPDSAALSAALIQLMFACITLLVVQALMARHTAALRRHVQQATWDANQDVLTGLPNRRSLMRRLDACATREDGALAVALIDVDHFKAVNDEHGHARGDDVLRTVAHVLRGYLGGRGTVGRYGGEEFLCLLPDIDAAAARQLCETLRARVADLPMGGVPITISVGLAVGTVPVPPQTLLESADAALYRAKARGRDCVQVTVRLQQDGAAVGAAPSPGRVEPVQGSRYA